MLPLGKTDAEVYAPLKGLGGWLLFFTFVMTIGAIRDFFTILDSEGRFVQTLISLWVIATAFGLYLTITLNPYAPTYWTITLLVIATFALLTGQWAAVPRCLIWLLYWERSKRVLVTYGSTGLGGKYGFGMTLIPDQPPEIKADAT